MKTRALALGLGAATLLSLGACDNNAKSGSTNAPKAQTKEAEKAAGSKTIAAGLAANSRFMTSAKAAGLDQTLAGAGPYTVFVPDDAAFGSDQNGALAATPQNRPQLTGVITNLILQGTVMAEDVGKLIDRNKGKALLATTAGGTLTATKENGKIVLTDAAGHKASITKADELYSNGVVHHIDAVLMPSKEAAAPPAVGQKAGQ